MYLARVVGSLQSSIKSAALEGVKLLLLRPTTSDGTSSDGIVVACDATQAGVGDLVYCCDGSEAALAFPDTFMAVDATIVAIVDPVG